MGNVCKCCVRGEGRETVQIESHQTLQARESESQHTLQTPDVEAPPIESQQIGQGKESESQQSCQGRETESQSSHGKEIDSQQGSQGKETESQQTSQGRDVVLVLPKIVIVDEDDREHEIYNPDTGPLSDEERERIEELGVKLGKSPRKSPQRGRPARKRLMLVKHASIEEEPGPSGTELRRRSSSSRGKESTTGMLLQQRAGIASSSILSEDPFEPVLTAFRQRVRPRLDLSFERVQENAERIRDLASRFYTDQPGTPTQELIAATSPVEQYKFDKFKAKCAREKKRRRSWW